MLTLVGWSLHQCLLRKVWWECFLEHCIQVGIIHIKPIFYKMVPYTCLKIYSMPHCYLQVAGGISGFFQNAPLAFVPNTNKEPQPMVCS